MKTMLNFIVFLFILISMTFVLSCASSKKNRTETGAGSGLENNRENTGNAITNDQEQFNMSPSYSKGNPMIIFEGDSPVTLMENGLKNRDIQTVRVVLYNALALDFVMPDGRTVRQSILDTKDPEFIALVDEVENHKADPRILK